MITVSKDNTGDYTSIQEAVDAISSSTVSETIFIKNGTYNEQLSLQLRIQVQRYIMQQLSQLMSQ